MKRLRWTFQRRNKFAWPVLYCYI